jgi:spore maturation protein CgeB
MKVLFSAVFTKASTNYAQADGFERLGHEVIRFPLRDIAPQIGWSATCDKLLDIVQKEKPDVVLFSKCHEIELRAWDAIKNMGCIVAYWYMDPMSNYSYDIEQRVKHSDVVFCALWDPHQHSLRLNPNSHFLQEGYDHLQNYPIKTDWPIKDVSFIGNLRSQKRHQYQQQIGFPVIQSAYGEEHSHAVCSTKINLNFTEGGCSDRVYKVLASKGFLLTDPWPMMEQDFVPDHDFAIFHDTQELREKIDFYLQNPDERQRIADNGYQTVQKFSRIEWARNIISESNKLLT